MGRYRVAIVEESAVVAEGLRALLAGGGEFEAVYVAEDIRTLAERFALVAPDAVVVSTSLSCGLPRNIRSAYPDLRSAALVALSVAVREEEIMRQFDSVVNIYDKPSQILKKLRAAVEQCEANPYGDSHDLSDRERDVLVRVAKGLSNKEIADDLNISIHTVMSHRKNIAHKTGIKSVAGLTVYALLNNLLDRNDVEL